MSDLRSKLLRLAHENPELRKDILPLLDKKAGKPAILNDRRVKDRLYKFTQSMYDFIAKEGGGYPDMYDVAENDAFAMEAEVQITEVFKWLVRNWESTAG